MHKLVNGEITTSSSCHQFIILNLHGDFLRPEKVDTVLLLLEHVSENFAIRMFSHELSELLVHNVCLLNIIVWSSGCSLPELWWALLSFDNLLNNVLCLISLLELCFGLLELLEELKTNLVGLEDLLLHADDVFRGLVKIILKFLLLSNLLFKVIFQLLVLVH